MTDRNGREWPAADNPIFLPAALYEAAKAQGIDMTNYAPTPMLTIDAEPVKAPATGKARWNSNMERVGRPDEKPEQMQCLSTLAGVAQW